MAVILELRNVEKRYNRFSASPILGPISLQLAEGEILGIRGHNGAGKTTLLALASGALKPDSGEVRCSPKAKNEIVYLPQELSLYSDLTGLENLRFWGMSYGLPEKVIPVRSKWLLDRLHLQEKGAEPVRTYSGGMKRRLHLASALMTTPKVLLLDEPTVGADDESVSDMLEVIKQHAEAGCAVIFVSHRQEEMRRICSRVITLENGRIAAEE